MPKDLKVQKTHKIVMIGSKQDETPWSEQIQTTYIDIYISRIDPAERQEN